MDSLLIQLLADGRARWREGLLLREGALAEASPCARGRHVTLLAPGESVLLARAGIPSRSSAEIARALPYALEDWLLQAPETQHFAWTRDAGQVAAAVAAQQTMEGWLAACTAADLEPDAIVPDVLALPWRDGQWTLLLEGTRALLRSGPFDGFACARALAPALIDAAWQRCTADARPQALRVLRVDGTLPALPADVEVLEEPITADAWMQAPPPGIDLRSGRFAARHRRGGAAPWRALAAALALAVISALALAATRYLILGREQALLQASIDTLFHRVLPDQHRIVDARAQMAEALAGARRKSGGAGTLDLLAQATLPLTALPGARLTRVVYRNGTLELGLRLPPPADYAALRRQLQAQGLQVALTAASAPGASTLLRIRPGAAP